MIVILHCQPSYVTVIVVVLLLTVPPLSAELPILYSQVGCIFFLVFLLFRMSPMDTRKALLSRVSRVKFHGCKLEGGVTFPLTDSR